MTADEWIDEFTRHSNKNPKTVLHATNLPMGSGSAVRGAPEKSNHVDAAAGVRRYKLASLCVAGLVGFAMARTLVR